MQMQTLSARIPLEDIEWLASLDIQGAVSPSDKLRALIAQMRRQYEGTLDYEANYIERFARLKLPRFAHSSTIIECIRRSSR